MPLRLSSSKMPSLIFWTVSETHEKLDNWLVEECKTFCAWFFSSFYEKSIIDQKWIKSTLWKMSEKIMLKNSLFRVWKMKKNFLVTNEDTNKCLTWNIHLNQRQFSSCRIFGNLRMFFPPVLGTYTEIYKSFDFKKLYSSNLIFIQKIF